MQHVFEHKITQLESGAPRLREQLLYPFFFFFSNSEVYSTVLFMACTAGDTLWVLFRGFAHNIVLKNTTNNALFAPAYITF